MLLDKTFKTPRREVERRESKEGVAPGGSLVFTPTPKSTRHGCVGNSNWEDRCVRSGNVLNLRVGGMHADDQIDRQRAAPKLPPDCLSCM